MARIETTYAELFDNVMESSDRFTRYSSVPSVLDDSRDNDKTDMGFAPTGTVSPDTLGKIGDVTSGRMGSALGYQEATDRNSGLLGMAGSAFGFGREARSGYNAALGLAQNNPDAVKGSTLNYLGGLGLKALEVATGVPLSTAGSAMKDAASAIKEGRNPQDALIGSLANVGIRVGSTIAGALLGGPIGGLLGSMVGGLIDVDDYFDGFSEKMDSWGQEAQATGDVIGRQGFDLLGFSSLFGMERMEDPEAVRQALLGTTDTINEAIHRTNLLDDMSRQYGSEEGYGGPGGIQGYGDYAGRRGLGLGQEGVGLGSGGDEGGSGDTGDRGDRSSEPGGMGGV